MIYREDSISPAFTPFGFLMSLGFAFSNFEILESDESVGRVMYPAGPSPARDDRVVFSFARLGEWVSDAREKKGM